jgi:hypothetical protein
LELPKLNFQVLRRTIATRAQKLGSVKDDRFDVCSVRLDRDGLSATEFNRFDYGRGRAGVLRMRDGYACSIGGQTLRNRCANAPGAAGNECHYLC